MRYTLGDIHCRCIKLIRPGIYGISAECSRLPARSALFSQFSCIFGIIKIGKYLFILFVNDLERFCEFVKIHTVKSHIHNSIFIYCVNIHADYILYQFEQSLFNTVYKSARSIVYKIVKILKLLVYLCEFRLRFKSQFLVLVSDNVINVPVRSNCKRNIAELSFQFMIFTFDNAF